MFEVYNRAGLGGGARSMMVEDYREVPVLREGSVAHDAAVETIASVSALRARATREPPMLEWRNLDEVVFDVLTLTRAEREAIYESLIQLVDARLDRANSV